MNKNEMAEVMAEQRRLESRAQSKRALIGVFVVIPAVVGVAVVAWLVVRAMGGG